VTGGPLIAAQPDVTEDEAVELLILRDRFGLSAEDVWARLPAWEVELLLAYARSSGEGEEDGGSARATRREVGVRGAPPLAALDLPFED
jgi:hypothetical protein